MSGERRIPDSVRLAAREGLNSALGHPDCPIAVQSAMSGPARAVLENAFAEAIMSYHAPVRSIGLTAHQSKVFAFIQAHIRERRIAPSYDEIAAHLGLRSKSSVHRVVHELRERGAIYFLDDRSRSICITRVAA